MSHFSAEEIEARAAAATRLYRSPRLPVAVWSEQVMGVRVTSHEGWTRRGFDPSRPITWPLFKLALSLSTHEDLPEAPGPIATPDAGRPPLPVSVADVRVEQLRGAVAELTQRLQAAVADAEAQVRALASAQAEIQTNVRTSVESVQASVDSVQASVEEVAAEAPRIRHESAAAGAAKLWTGVCTTGAEGTGTLVLPAGYFTSIRTVTATARRSQMDRRSIPVATVTGVSLGSVQVVVTDSRALGEAVGPAASRTSQVQVDVLVVGV